MGEAVGIMLYATAGSAEAVAIECSGRARAVELYTVLAANAFRMGNPSNVVPAELACRCDKLLHLNSRFISNATFLAVEIGGTILLKKLPLLVSHFSSGLRHWLENLTDIASESTTGTP